MAVSNRGEVVVDRTSRGDKPMRLGDFAGDWTMTRVIADRMTAQTGHLSGRCRFGRAATGLSCEESGMLRMGSGVPMAARRRYLWDADGPCIAVRFADGRAFHRFDPGQLAPTAQHDCPPDTYRVAYDLRDWPRWRVVWTVTGPRKDYTMTTDYVLAAPPVLGQNGGDVSGVSPCPRSQTAF